jgi:hypothetical protein
VKAQGPRWKVNVGLWMAQARQQTGDADTLSDDDEQQQRLTKKRRDEAVRRAARKARQVPAPKDAHLHVRYSPAEAAAYAVSRGAPTYSALHKILDEVRALSGTGRVVKQSAGGGRSVQCAGICMFYAPTAGVCVPCAGVCAGAGLHADARA